MESSFWKLLKICIILNRDGSLNEDHDEYKGAIVTYGLSKLRTTHESHTLYSLLKTHTGSCS